jgi:DNA-binding protein Fis
MTKTLSFITILILVVAAATAQTTTKTLRIKPTIIDSLSGVNKIPELKVFIESAIKNSPLLQANEREMEQILEKIKIEKKSWQDFIYLDANARYGLFNQLSISNSSVATADQLAVQTANEQLNYYVGLSFRLPISKITSGRNELNVLKLDAKTSQSKKEQLKQEITLTVIDEYYKLLNFQESMDVLQDVVQTIEISYLKAVKDVESGTLDLSEFSTLVAARGKAKESYSKTKNDFYSQFYKLQVLSGINLIKR